MLLLHADQLQSRAIALLTFADALGRDVLSPVAVTGDGIRTFQKRPGLVVIAAAPGLDEYARSFDPVPALPAVGSVRVALDVRPADPALAPRRATVDLPRDPAPVRALQPDSLFQPVRITLLPTPLVALQGLSCAVSVTVRRASDGRVIEGALVRVRPDGGRPPAFAMTDPAGNALLLVSGVPLTSPGAGAVVRSGIDGEVDVVVDPLLARFHRSDEIDAARQSARERTANFIDPDDLDARLGASAVAAGPIELHPARTTVTEIVWAP